MARAEGYNKYHLIVRLGMRVVSLDGVVPMCRPTRTPTFYGCCSTRVQTWLNVGI